MTNGWIFRRPKDGCLGYRILEEPCGQRGALGLPSSLSECCCSKRILSLFPSGCLGTLSIWGRRSGDKLRHHRTAKRWRIWRFLSMLLEEVEICLSVGGIGDLSRVRKELEICPYGRRKRGSVVGVGGI